jgi:RimJ/RimL family protein N-acetyltransferase
MIGELTLRPVDPVVDGDLLHSWLTHPKAEFWMMGELRRDEVVAEFERIASHPGHDAFLGLHDGAPAFIAERYDPHVYLAGVYPIREGDVGMHFLVAPTGTPIHGFTRAVIAAVMDALFADPATQRIVVEPDVRNTAVHTLNREVGFQMVDTVVVTGKVAYLSLCTRSGYLAKKGALR